MGKAIRRTYPGTLGNGGGKRCHVFEALSYRLMSKLQSDGALYAFIRPKLLPRLSLFRERRLFCELERNLFVSADLIRGRGSSSKRDPTIPITITETPGNQLPESCRVDRLIFETIPKTLVNEFLGRVMQVNRFFTTGTRVIRTLYFASYLAIQAITKRKEYLGIRRGPTKLRL